MADRVIFDPLVLLCRAHCLPVPVCEYRFAPPRRFKFDWAFVYAKIAIEQEGGIFAGGRHTRGVGYLRDMEKYNLAALQGWKVLRFTPQQIQAGDPIPLLRELLGVRGSETPDARISTNDLRGRSQCRQGHRLTTRVRS